MEKFIIGMLMTVLKSATPEIIDSIREAVAEGKKKASETSNIADDLLFGFLEVMVGKPGDSLGD